MHLDKRGYIYESFRQGGHVKRRYHGRGDAATALFYLDSIGREARTDFKLQIQTQIEKIKNISTDLKNYSVLLDAYVNEAMSNAGYHKHKRGNWRKKRHKLNNPMLQTKTEIVKEEEDFLNKKLLKKSYTNSAAAKELLDLAKKKGYEDLVIDNFCSLSRTASEPLIEKMSGNNELLREGYLRHLEKSTIKIAGVNSSQLEMQLAKRVAMCEMSVCLLERLHAGLIGKEIKIWETVGKQLDAAHRRHLSAIKALATVRKAQLPDFQINVAEKQININN